MPQTTTPHLEHTRSIPPQTALGAICCTKDFISSEIPKFVVGESCIHGFKCTVKKMFLLRMIWVHGSLLWKSLMTKVGLKNYILIIQTVHSLAYLCIWRERKTRWHYFPRPLKVRLSSSSYSTENSQSIAFSTKTSIFTTVERHLNSVIYLHIIFLQAAGIAQSVQRLATRRKFRGWNPSDGKILPTLPGRQWGQPNLL